MKRIMIICGAGHATSTVVRTKVESWLKKEGLTNEVEVMQSSISAQTKDIAEGKYDIVISTTQVPESIKDVLKYLSFASLVLLPVNEQFFPTIVFSLR